MQLLGDTFAANKKVLGQVRAKIGNFLANSDISNRIGQAEYREAAEGPQDDTGNDGNNDNNEDNGNKTWRDRIVSSLTAMGQLKRKGKFDLKNPFMKKSKKKGDNDAISQPGGQPDPNSLLMGSLNTNGSALEDINGNCDENKVGEYTPTEFPLEAKLNELTNEN